jgi:Mlc titration factor MtfA (ptsG expression regulator)
MFDLWFKGRRRKRLAAKPVPPSWESILQQRLWYWPYLSRTQQIRLLKLMQIFIHEKEIVVPAEIKQPDEARVLVAGAACTMLLGFEDLYCFDRVKTVIFTLRPFRQRVHNAGVPGVFGEMIASGVYQRGAPIALSWPDFSRECFHPELTRNVAIHEFAHHIDDLNGAMDGEPPFPNTKQAEAWKLAADEARARVDELDSIGISTAIDDYGLTDEMEFFAVACEAFFCNPNALANEFPTVFELLESLFRLDTRLWFVDYPGL